MPGKVFISCGQRFPGEKRIANEIRGWLKSEGFEPFLAFKTQSMKDLNNEIIGNLESSDYFIVVDFKREVVSKKDGQDICRGSLFTNQELALASYMGFEETIFLQEKETELEGMTRFFLSNPEIFEKEDEVLEKIKHLIKERAWNPTYSRQLVLANKKLTPVWVPYKDHTTNDYIPQNVWNAFVLNRRKIPAFSTVARLRKVIDPNGKEFSPDRGLLKWAGQSTYEILIMPGEDAQEHFTLFSIRDGEPSKIYLLSNADVIPRQSINEHLLGKYFLKYQVISPNFPILSFTVELELTGQIQTTVARVI